VLALQRPDLQARGDRMGANEIASVQVLMAAAAKIAQPQATWHSCAARALKR
jgi:hypothetical protein